MELDFARLLAQPVPGQPGTARIFSRSEAAEMARARDALRQSLDPADEALAEAADEAVRGFVGGGMRRLHRATTIAQATERMCGWLEAAAAHQSADQQKAVLSAIAAVREAARATSALYRSGTREDIALCEAAHAAVEKYADGD